MFKKIICKIFGHKLVGRSFGHKRCVRCGVQLWGKI